MRAACAILLAAALPAAESDGWGTAVPRLAAVNLVGLGAIGLYGTAVWDWGNSSFALRSEGGFGAGTPYGGADKLGHAFTGSAITAGAASLARSAGAGQWQAATLGAATGLAWTTAIELGDGFSPAYGASWQDQAANLAGVGFEWLRQGLPWMAERVQFRWEWLPSPLMLDGTTTDIFSDYSGSRYLLAFPIAPWVGGRHPLRFVELLAGYGTTGFDDPDRSHYREEERTPFVGIGLSLGAALDAATWRRPGRLLEHVQVPYTAWPWQQR